MVPYTYNEVGERTIHHMEECGWIGDTQRGQNCIYLIYDGIHFNALKLNKENNIAEPKQSSDTIITSPDQQDKRTRENVQPNANQTQDTAIHTTNSKRNAHTNTNKTKKGKQIEGRATNTHYACVFVARRTKTSTSIQKRQQPSKMK